MLISKPYFILKSLLLLWLLASSFGANAFYKNLSVCASPSWIPYHWENEQRVRGVFLEIFNRFLRTEKMDADIVRVGSWARCLQQVKSGEITLLMGAYKTQERQNWGLYSVPVAFDDTKVFYFEPSLKLQRFNDLINLRGAARVGSSYGQFIDQFFEQQKAYKKLELTYSDESMILMASKGRVDYFAGVESNILALLYKLKQTGEVSVNSKIYDMERSFSKNSLHFVFSKQNGHSQELLKRFNLFFQQTYNQKQIEALKSKYSKTFAGSLGQ